jgi:hypothetical protein
MTTATLTARRPQLDDGGRPTNLDTSQLRVLPPAPARWHSDLARPEVVHLLSTDDGHARIVEFDGQPAVVSVCGAALSIDPTPLPELPTRG